MFLKQYNYQPKNRSGSQSSGSDVSKDAARADSPPAKKEEPQTAGGVVTSAIAGRRRSSDSTKFAGMTKYKRSSGDLAAAERRTSFSDQAQQGGIFSKAWNSFTKGT